MVVDALGRDINSGKLLRGDGGKLCRGCCGGAPGEPCDYCSGMNTNRQESAYLNTTETLDICSWCKVYPTGSNWYGTWERINLSGYTGGVILTQNPPNQECTWQYSGVGNFGSITRNYVAFGDAVPTQKDCTVGTSTTRTFDRLFVHVTVLSTTAIRIYVRYKNDWFSYSIQTEYTVSSSRSDCVPSLSGQSDSIDWSGPNYCASGDLIFTQDLNINYTP